MCGSKACRFCGVAKPVIEDGVVRGLVKPHKNGKFATWNFPVNFEEGRIEAAACDDLIGCAAIVMTFLELARLNIQTTNAEGQVKLAGDAVVALT